MNAPFVSYGSQQLRLFRRGMRDGLPIEQAAEAADYEIETARLVAADDAKNPPPPEAFELLYDPDARAAALTQENDDMARGRMAREKDDAEAGEGGGVSGEYKRPDAARALKIFTDEIAPKHAHMATIKGDLSDPYKRIKDECHFPRKVLDFLMQLEDMEDAKRDHWLLAFRLGCTELKLFVPRDLVTMAQGEDGDDVVPAGDREDDDLATLDEDEDTDEAEDAEQASDEEPFEASEEELALQRDRRPVQEAQAEADRLAEAKSDGTGAATRRAMSTSNPAAPSPARGRRAKAAPDLSVVH